MWCSPFWVSANRGVFKLIFVGAHILTGWFYLNFVNPAGLQNQLARAVFTPSVNIDAYITSTLERNLVPIVESTPSVNTSIKNQTGSRPIPSIDSQHRSLHCLTLCVNKPSGTTVNVPVKFIIMPMLIGRMGLGTSLSVKEAIDGHGDGAVCESKIHSHWAKATISFSERKFPPMFVAFSLIFSAGSLVFFSFFCVLARSEMTFTSNSDEINEHFQYVSSFQCEEA